MRYEDLAVGECYHIFTRGVDRRPIFLDDCDYQRFYEGMYLFNDNRQASGVHDIPTRSSLLSTADTFDDRERMVDIIAYCLMTNHYHLLVRQLTEEGISKFLHRLNMGYAKYFNLQHHRTGTLFDGRFQAVLIEHESQLEHVPKYIHLNVLDRFGLPWRDGSISDWESAIYLLDQYPWSSHGVYSDRPQELPVVQSSLVTEYFPTKEAYQHSLKDWSSRYLPEFET